MSTLRQLIDTVGEPLLDCVAAPNGIDEEVRDLLVHDQTDPPEIRPGDLVLGIGLESEEKVRSLLHSLASQEAAGLVIKGSLVGDSTAEAAQASGVGLLAIPTGASWAHLVTLIQTALRRGILHVSPDRAGTSDSGDIFALADAIYGLVEEPITIEDRLSRVIGYSAGQEETDFGRAESIIGRKVPDRFLRLLEKRGVFEELASSGKAVYVDGIGPDLLPRLAVAITAGDELLGYLWAACRSKPTKKRVAALEAAAKDAALHLLQHRAGADIERRLEADLVAAALDGGGAATDILTRLGLGGVPVCVLVLSIKSEDGDVPERISLLVRDVVSAEFTTNRIPAKAAILGGLIYVLAGGGHEDLLASVKQVCLRSLERSRMRLGASLMIGIGGVAETVWDIPRSRQEAEIALRVTTSSRWSEPLAMIDEVRMQALLLRFEEIALEEKQVYMRKIDPLIESDSTKGTSYLQTLSTYLDASCNISETSKRLTVHPNTVRYRLAKAQELTGIDLSNQNDRLALTILAAFSHSDIQPR